MIPRSLCCSCSCMLAVLLGLVSNSWLFVVTHLLTNVRCCGIWCGVMRPQDDSWQRIDGDNTVEALHDDLVRRTMAVIDGVGSKPVGKLWVE